MSSICRTLCCCFYSKESAPSDQDHYSSITDNEHRPQCDSPSVNQSNSRATTPDSAFGDHSSRTGNTTDDASPVRNSYWIGDVSNLV